MNEVTINKKKYPFHLGNAAVAKATRMAKQAGGSLTDDNLEYNFMMIYCAIEQGYRKSKQTKPKEFDSWEVVADALDDDPGAWDGLNELITEAYGPQDPDEKK